MKTAFYLIIFSFFALLVSCSKVEVEKGVSQELAIARKNVINEIQYGLQFDIPEDQSKSINGKITIYCKITKDASPYLFLDFSEDIDHLKKLSVNGKESKIIFENEHIAIPTNLLTDGSNEIAIDFIAGDLSLNRNADYLYTLFVPDRASTCFPSFDQPDIKASFYLELKVPKGWEAVANTRPSIISESGGKNLFEFVVTKPISTYQFAFAVGKFNKVTDTASDMTMYYRETDTAKVAGNVKEIFQLHRQSRTWLEDYTAIPYPFVKLDFVLIPTFQYGGMEHPGNIFYRESSLILDSSASVNQKMRRASLIAHETSHMWFGNLVTMKWFDDVWLKEVFANLMASKIVNPQFPEMNHDLRFLMAHYPSAYEIDRSEGSHPIQQKLDNLKNAGSLYGAVIYQKAPIMMRKLETLMGETNFKNGLRDYLGFYSYQNATWDDLIYSLKKFTKKDLLLWNRAWILSAGMPALDYTLDKNLTVKLVNDSDAIIWPQVFQFKITDGNETEIEAINVDSLQTVPLKLSSQNLLVTPNYKGRGYGYFAADEQSRNNMLATVNGVKDPEERAAIWISIWEYILRGELDVQQSMETMLSGITTEKDPLILEYITNNLNTLFWQFTKAEDRQLLSQKMDDTLFELMATEKDLSLKRILFNCYTKIASSKEGIVNLKKFWQNEITLGLEISEQDHIDLAYELAVRDAEGSEQILATQIKNTKNPDRKSAMQFTIAALSPDEVKRDNFFKSLKDPVNREHEPWVLEALSYLHHPLRAQQSVKYIKPSLEMLEDIQRTGDIFFPKGWVDNTVSTYQSKEAADAVKQFLNDHPDLSSNLKNKLLQSADRLFRAEKILSSKRPQNL